MDLQDSTLTASILSSSTPRHPTYGGFAGPARSPSAGRAGSGRPLTAQTAFSSGSSPGGGGGGAHHQPQRRPYSAQQSDLDLSMAGLEESECDTLPFALDSEASPRLQPAAGPGGGFSGGGGAAADDESDVAVGAFVRLIEHAPPLNPGRGAAGLARSRMGGSGLAATGGAPAADTNDFSAGSGAAEGFTVAAGLSQLAKLRAQLEPITA